ncbi:MAG: GFA family protein [Burkholderiales bacterium]|nr:GFA family protein [Burkholderiales bacterium]
MDKQGKCQCGAISYIVTGQLTRLVNCHCQRCRSMNGGAFSSYVVIAGDQLTITSGAEQMRQYAVSEHINKHFCPTCGTPVFNSNPVTYPGLNMLYLGTLEQAAKLPPTVNIFCDSKLAWVDALAALPSFAGGPPPHTSS